MGTQIGVWAGDYGYTIDFQLLDAQGNPFDLTNNTGLLFTAQLVQLTKKSFSGSMSVITASSGICSFAPAAGNFAHAGQYNAQIQVSFSGEVVTFGNITVTANPKIPF